MEIITTYVRSENGNRIIIMEGDRQSFRCRQRNKINGCRCKPLRFVSFKEMQKEIKTKKIKIDRMEPIEFFTMGKL